MTDLRPRIFLTRRLPPDAQRELESHKEVILDMWMEDRPIPREILLERVRDVQGILCLLTEKIDSELIAAVGPQLKVVSTMSVGADHIDIPLLRSRSIKIGNTPNVLTDATADLTLALILMASRRLGEGMTSVRDGLWGTWSPTWLCGMQLGGKTIGIVGLGRIGTAVGRRLRAFNVGRILYCSRAEKIENAEMIAAEFVEFSQLLSQSDVVVITCDLNDSTKQLFNSAAFEKMKPTSLLINTSRGGVVHTGDLVDALERKSIAGCGLDVTDPEPLPKDHRLLSFPACIVVPHLGSATIDTREAMARLAVKNVLAGVLDCSLTDEV